MVTEDLTGQAMAKQKVLPFGKLHMRGFFTRERDDSFSPASRGTEMSVSACRAIASATAGLWPNIIFPFFYLLKWEYCIKPASFNRKGEFKRQSL